MLTAKQYETYHFIRQYIREFGYAPTEAEIAEGIGIKSRGVVHRYVSALAEEGFITIEPGHRRNIMVTNLAESSTGLPILGNIAAGSPIEAIEDRRFFDISETIVKPNRFLLEVKGDSMIGDNICNGDYVICKSANTADEGVIVVALVDNQEVTLKRIKCNKDGTVLLVPSNPKMLPMKYPADQVKIQGVYLGLLRLDAMKN